MGSTKPKGYGLLKWTADWVDSELNVRCEEALRVESEVC